MAVSGVDYAFSRPRPDALAKAGYRFACRYGGPGTDSKHLHADEARALAAAGVWIVANAEGSAGGLLGAWTAGADWARRADAHFRACGMPPDRPIYLSVDIDATAAQLEGPIADALLGARSVLGAGRVGIYGGYRTIVWAQANGLADWFWQTYAWSGGKWARGNHVEQYRNGVTIDGADCDLNRALVDDFGQWMPGQSPGANTTGDDDMAWRLFLGAQWADPEPRPVRMGDLLRARAVADDQELAHLQDHFRAQGWSDAVILYGQPGTKVEHVSWNELGQMPATATVTLTDDQVAQLVGAVVAHPDNPLTDADKPAIVAAVKQAIAELVTGVADDPVNPTT